MCDRAVHNDDEYREADRLEKLAAEAHGAFAERAATISDVMSIIAKASNNLKRILDAVEGDVVATSRIQQVLKLQCRVMHAKYNSFLCIHGPNICLPR